MRILAIAQHFWPELGGAEVMLRRLAGAWADAGHAVTVWTPRWDASWPERETGKSPQGGEFRIERHPASKLRLLGTLGYVRRLRRMLRERAGEFDVVYVSMFKHAAYAAATAGCGLPVVIRGEGGGVSGDMAWQDSARFGGGIRRACQSAAGFAAPSAAVRDELRAAGYDERRTRFIPNGVDVPDGSWRREDAAVWRKELGLANRPTVVFTGRIHAAKGLHDLANAMPLLDGAQALLVGEGPERAALLGRPGLVCVRQVDCVTPFLRAADCFVLPSYEEGLSLALLEALALGMPCVASAIPAHRGLLPAELLPLAPTHDPAGLAAALRPLLSGAWPHGPAQRRIVAERFSLAAAARGHVEWFQELAGRCA